VLEKGLQLNGHILILQIAPVVIRRAPEIKSVRLIAPQSQHQVGREMVSGVLVVAEYAVP
jgi:hypothetical protein